MRPPQLGANVTHLDWQWNYAAGIHHWQPRKPDHGLSLVPPKSALWLDWRGARIGPMPLVTGFDTHDLVAQICRQPRAYSWQLLNRVIMLKELAISGGEFNPAFRRKRRLQVARDMLFGNHWLYDQLTQMCPDVVVAPTIEELAGKMNALVGDGSVDVEAMRSAATRYDACIERGPRFHDDEQLRRIEFARRWVGDRLRTCKFQKILDPKAGPLVAIREFIISRKSMGGLQTDLDCRVLDRGGRTHRGAVRRGRSRRLRRRRHERQARPRGHVPRRLPARRPHRRPPRSDQRSPAIRSPTRSGRLFTLNAKMIFSTPVTIAHAAISVITERPPASGLAITRMPNSTDRPPAR